MVIHELFERLKCGHRVCTLGELNDALLACQIGDAHLGAKWDRLLAQNAHRTAMQVYMSDGWGGMMWQRHRCSGLPRDPVVVRETGIKHDFVCQRALSRVDSFEEIQSCILIGDPVPLEYGKSAFDYFEACVPFQSTLRGAGHLGFALHVYLWDEALVKPMTKFFFARHEMFHAYVDLGDEANELSLRI